MKKYLYVLIGLFLFNIVFFFTYGNVTFASDPTMSVWADAKWLVALLPFIGGTIAAITFYRSSTSGSEIQDHNMESSTFGKMLSLPGNTVTKWAFGFSLALFIVTIVVIIAVHGER